MSPSKDCRVCRETKPLEEFPRNRRRKDGRDGRCSVCNRAAAKAWQAANPERVRAQSQKARDLHPERNRVYQLEYYRRVRDTEQFKDARRAYKQRDYVKEYARRQAKDRFADKRALVNSFRSCPCVDCGGVFPPVAMDFDHVRGEKKFTIANWMNGKARATEAELIAEIAKCEVRCANCHRIRHHNERLAKKEAA